MNSSASSATDGNLLECNGAALECAHLTRGDVIGKPFWETFWRSVTPTAQGDLRGAIRGRRGASRGRPRAIPAESPRGTRPNRRAFPILLIEDNPADAGPVLEALEEHGVEGEPVLNGDGDSAIRCLSGHRQ